MMMRRLVACCTALVLAALTGLALPARADVIVAGYEEGSILRFQDDGTPLDPIVAPFSFEGVIGPAGITFGPDGLLYVANQASVFVPGLDDSIVQVDPETGDITPFIDLPSGYVPAGIRFGPDGNLYVCHNGGQGAGEGSGSVDCYNGQTGDFIASVVTNLTQPTGLLFDNKGNLYVSNFGDGSVVKRNQKTGRVKTLVAAGSGGLAGPAGLQIGPRGNLFVADLLSGAVRVYDKKTGAFRGDFVPAGGDLNNQFPSDLLLDAQGNLLVADLGGSFTQPQGNVKLFDATGAFVTDFATNIFGASQLIRAPN
jgi:DNA-binding beta-propeller fold protein YncE